MFEFFFTGFYFSPFQAKYEATIETYKKKLGEYFRELPMFLLSAFGLYADALGGLTTMQMNVIAPTLRIIWNDEEN